MCSQTTTDIDAAILAGSPVGPQVRTFLADMRSYAQTDLGYASLSVCLAAISGKRVPYDFAQAMIEAAPTWPRFPLYQVFPEGVWAANIADNATAGLHEFCHLLQGSSTWTLVAGSGALPADCGPAAVIAVSDAGITSTATFTLTLTNQQGVSKTVTITAQTYAADAQHVVGETAVTGAGMAVGATSIPSTGVLAAAVLTAGEYALIYESDSLQEVVLLGTITTNAAACSATINAYTTAAKVWPLYNNVTAVGTASGGAGAELIQIYARPDRAIAL
jgi:hypothetical protein